MKSRARSSSIIPLTANMVGVGALFGDGAFLEDIVRWVLGLPIERKSGVGPNGENCSALEDEERAARYGRFQWMNLGYPLAAIIRERVSILHVIAELNLAFFLLPL
jgi:hypothetical protein